MTTKEFIKKFNLSEGWNKSKTSEFIKELGNSLRELLEEMKVSEDIKKFNECVKQVRSKFDGISNKTPYGIPEEVWSYFYKREVISLRDEFCPEISKAMREDYKAEGIRRKEAKEQEELKNLPKILKIENGIVFTQLPNGQKHQTPKSEFDKEWVIYKGHAKLNKEAQAKFDRGQELLTSAATNFIMSRGKWKKVDNLTWLLMLGNDVEEMHKLYPELSRLDIIKLIRQRIDLVVGPGWWDAIKDE